MGHMQVLPPFGIPSVQPAAVCAHPGRSLCTQQEEYTQQLIVFVKMEDTDRRGKAPSCVIRAETGGGAAFRNALEMRPNVSSACSHGPGLQQGHAEQEAGTTHAIGEI